MPATCKCGSVFSPADYFEACEACIRADMALSLRALRRAAVISRVERQCIPQC